MEKIGKIIQWASNQQMDLMKAYEQQWGVVSKVEVWESYTKLLRELLPQKINDKQINQKRIEQLMAFLTDINQPYHLEMSTDEMARLFLDYLEKN